MAKMGNIVTRQKARDNEKKDNKAAAAAKATIINPKKRKAERAAPDEDDKQAKKRKTKQNGEKKMKKQMREKMKEKKFNWDAEVKSLSLIEYPTAPRKPRLTFFSLPGEVRNMIYELALPDFCENCFKKPPDEPRLIRASNRIRTEARSVWFWKTGFKFYVMKMDFSAVTAFVSSISARELGVIKMLDLHLHLRWKAIHSIVPLLMALRQTRCPSAKVTFFLSPNSSISTREYISGLLELPALSVAEKWTQQFFDTRVQALMDRVETGDYRVISKRLASMQKPTTDAMDNGDGVGDGSDPTPDTSEARKLGRFGLRKAPSKAAR